jgi:hypothetical protein
VAGRRFELKDFDGCDGCRLMGLFFGGGPDIGPFKPWIDDVRFDSFRSGR